MKKGVIKCAQWLSYCLSIGYDKKDLDKLEEIWWKYHDKNGTLITEDGKQKIQL